MQEYSNMSDVKKKLNLSISDVEDDKDKHGDKYQNTDPKHSGKKGSHNRRNNRGGLEDKIDS